MTLTDDRTVHTFLAQPADDPVAGLLPGSLLVFTSKALWRHPDGPDRSDQWHVHEYVVRITRIDRETRCGGVLEWELARVLSEAGKPPYKWARNCPTAGGWVLGYFRKNQDWRRPSPDEVAGVTTLVGDVNDFAVMRECEGLRRGFRRGQKPVVPMSPPQRVMYLRKREPRDAKVRALSYHRDGR
jgi:hypothetical protein